MYPVMGVLLISAVAVADVKVTQSPGIIDVIEGGQFQMSCTFTASNVSPVFGFSWYKQASGHEKSCVTNTSEEFVGRVLKKHGQFLNISQITVMEANRNDSGIYYCEVDSPEFGKGAGMGTQVTVKGQAESKEEASKQKLIALSSALVVTTLVLLLIAILIFLSRNKCQERTPRTRNKAQGDTSNNVVYADLRIAKPKTQRPGNRTNNHVAGSPPHRGEDNVVYAAVGPGLDKKNKNRAPVRSRNQMEEPVVYGMVRPPVGQ
ncbi:uncharacterized protein LOC144497825 [Mustelus asterias]